MAGPRTDAAYDSVMIENLWVVAMGKKECKDPYEPLLVA